MKLQLQVVCLFALFYGVLTMSEAEEDKVADTCKKQLTANDSDMKILDETEMFNMRVINKKQYCLLACFYKGIGTVDANNKVLYEKAKEELEPLKKENKVVYDKIDKLLQECTKTTIPDKDECESIKKFMDCMEVGAKKMGIDA